MKRHSILAVVVSFMLIGGPDLLGDERTMDFAGCYHLELGRWTRLWIFTATPMPNQIPPAAFQLDRSPVSPADSNRLRITPNRTVARKPSQLDGWVLASDGNTVSITWTDGFTGGVPSVET
jgi:hypothetical protein